MFGIYGLVHCIADVPGLACQLWAPNTLTQHVLVLSSGLTCAATGLGPRNVEDIATPSLLVIWPKIADF